jgi:hypothetical protein
MLRASSDNSKVVVLMPYKHRAKSQKNEKGKVNYYIHRSGYEVF